MKRMTVKGVGRLFFLLIDNEANRQFVEQLYDQYKNLLFMCANEILQDKQLSEDAIQETFIRVLDNIHKIGDLHCPRTRNFLVTICRNVSINMYNQKKRVNSADIETLDMEEDFEHTAHSPLEIVVSNDTVVHIKDAIKKLKPLYRDVLLLKPAHGRSNDEICKMLQIAPETLKKRLARGRKMLVQILREEGLR